MILNKKGFSLIELLTVLLILGILASIATPLYMAHVQRARMSEAVATLALIRQAERDYFAKHNTYLAVASPNLSNDPEDSTPGLGIDVGTAQYFSNAAYSVAVPGASTHFTTPPTTPVDFVASVSGSASVACAGEDTDCAVRQADVSNYQLEMDNSGRIFVTFNGTDWKAW